MPKDDTEKLFSVCIERAPNRIEMSVESKQAEPLGTAGMFKKMASTVRQSMARYGPKRILVAAVISIGLVAILVAVTIVSTRRTSDEDLRTAEFTTTRLPSTGKTIETDNVPRKSTTKFSTSRGFSDVTISSTRLTEPVFTTSRGSASETSIHATSEATTIAPVPATPTPETSTTEWPSDSSVSESATTSETETTVDIPTTELPFVTTTTSKEDSELTTRIWSSELDWKRFLDPEGNTECDCEGCEEVPDRKYPELSEVSAQVDSLAENLLFFIEKSEEGGDRCVIIKSISSAYSNHTVADPDRLECEYKFDLLREYYVRFSRLEFPEYRDNFLDIDEAIVGYAQDCKEVIALKQCKNLPDGIYFAECR